MQTFGNFFCIFRFHSIFVLHYERGNFTKGYGAIPKFGI